MPYGGGDLDLEELDLENLAGADPVPGALRSVPTPMAASQRA
jgi:hypothetical protein